MKRDDPQKALYKARLNKFYDYLSYAGLIKNKADLAKKIGVHPCSLSSALGASNDYITRGLIIKVGDAFPKIVSTNWLLTGEGSMLLPKAPYRETIGNMKSDENGNPIVDSQPVEDKNVIIELRKQIEDLKAQLERKELQLGEMDARIRQKDDNLNTLLKILSGNLKL